MPEQKSTHSSKITKRIGCRVSEATPAVSVVIPAYNTAEYIGETLDSLFSQTFCDFEAIVVNDGSPDTPQLETALQPHSDNIVYIQQSNAGAGAARNTAIEHARGQLIAFLDGDDIWSPNFLASQQEFLNSNRYDMVYCDAFLFGMASVEGKTFMDDAPSSGTADLDALLDLRCNVITSGTVVRKEAIEKAGMFERERVHAEDFHLWLRVAKSGSKIGYQRLPLLKYRVRLDSLSGDGISRIERGIGVFQRARRTIELTATQQQIIERRLRGFESDLAVAKGKSMLLDGRFIEAAAAFSEANRHCRSTKMTAIALLSRVLPRTLLKFYRLRRQSDIEFTQNREKSL